jgi:hypothetical protein
MHRIDRSVEAAGEERAEYRLTDGSLPAGSADNGDRSRIEDRVQRFTCRDVASRVRGRLVGRVRLQLDHHLDFAVIEAPGLPEAERRQHAQHLLIRRHDVRDETAHAGSPGVGGEPLEKRGSHAVAMLFVGDGDRHLGGSGVPERHV